MTLIAALVIVIAVSITVGVFLGRARPRTNGSVLTLRLPRLGRWRRGTGTAGGFSATVSHHGGLRVHGLPDDTEELPPSGSTTDPGPAPDRVILRSVPEASIATDGEPLKLGRSATVALVTADGGVVLVHRVNSGPASLGPIELDSSAVPVTRLSQSMTLGDERFDLGNLVQDGPTARISAHWSSGSPPATAGNEMAASISEGPGADLRAARLLAAFAGVGQRSAVWALDAIAPSRADQLDIVVGVARCPEGLQIVGAIRGDEGRASIRDRHDRTELRLLHEYVGILTFAYPVLNGVEYEVHIRAEAGTDRRLDGRIWIATERPAAGSGEAAARPAPVEPIGAPTHGASDSSSQIRSSARDESQRESDSNQGEEMVIRVNPESIRAYGVSTQEKLNEINGKLVSMLNEIVGVNYTGENAVAFKTGCADMGVEFSNALRLDLRAIVDAINAATGAIIEQLGGIRVHVDVQTSPLSRPAVPPGDGTYNADLSLLETLSSDIGRTMGEIENLLEVQLTALKNTDWTGNAKDRAVQEVSRFTASATGKTAEAKTSMTKYISDQVAALRAADR